jgi:hypothetical protein
MGQRKRGADLIARLLALAVVGTCLIAAAPALAKVKTKAKPRSAQEAVPITTLPSDAPQPAPAVRASGARFSQEGRQSFLHELPGGFQAGVGIFSVHGVHERPRHEARTDRMRDVTPKQKKVAAVGLRLSF